MAEITVIDPELQVLLGNKQDGYNYRERRQQDWKENYTLYRDRVTINRLTQRQSVNMPLMKQTIKTLLKDVDDMPVLFFEELDNNEEKQTFQNEYWKWTADMNNMEIQDIVDKKQVFMFGRSFDQWQIVDGMIKMTIIDPQDILVSRYCDPTELNSTRFLIQTGIYVPLKELEKSKVYDQEAIKKLRAFYATDEGLIKVASNNEMAVEKNKKMADMGLQDVDSPELGETWVELTQHFVYDNKEGEEEERYLKTEADDQQIILNKPLDEVIGKTKDDYWKTHLPYNSWADDLERQDFWSDSVADIVRTPNKVLNSWMSQLVENRTMRNFGMNYYDSSDPNFNPSTFQPVPWGWYPLPGKPSEVMQKVDIPDLSESLDEMQYMVGIIEKATGATATQQGTQTERQVTLGEVELALGEAKERVKGMSKFYTPAWKRRGEIFLKLIEAGADQLDGVEINKKGKNTNDNFPKFIEPRDWMSKAGYQTKVWSQDEKEANDTQMLTKLSATLQLMPDNTKLREINQRKALEFAGLTPDEINNVMEQEQKKLDQAALANDIQGLNQQQALNPQQPQAQIAPPKPKPQPQPQPVKKMI